jgi:hypothetical protein
VAGSARKALEEQLGAKVPKGLAAALSDDELARLADAVRQAREVQARELDKALEDALGHIPRLARGPIRRIVFG